MRTHERWAAIDGFDGLYSVSSAGRVRSETRVVVYASGKKQTVRERIMSPATKRSGHKSVMLYGDQRLRLHVHRLVALAFIGEPPTELHEVAHCDGDPANNCADNLRWATRSENHADKVPHGTHNRGESHPLCKLTDEQVRNIRASESKSAEIAAQYGINPKYVRAIKTMKTRRWS